MSEYTVTYLEHSLFHDAERKTETVTTTQLVELLQKGFVSVLDVRIK